MNKGILTKGLSLILSGTLLFSMVGCGEDTKVSDSSAVEENTSAQESVAAPVDRLNVIDKLDGKYAGMEYKIITTQEWLFSTSNSSTPLDKAIKGRIELLNQALDINVSVETTAESTLEQQLKDGKVKAHLICASSAFLARMTAEGLLQNMATLPYFDEGAGYMPDHAITSQTAEDKLYTLSSPATLALSSALVVFYRKNLVDSTGADPISAVKNGEWTWAKFKEIATTAAKQNSCYGVGYLSDKQELLGSIYGSSGSTFLKNDIDGLQISYNTEAVSVANNMYDMLFGNKKLCAGSNHEVELDSFKNGKTVFLVARLDNVVEICTKDQYTAEDEWGILPLPKHSAKQTRYYSPVSSIATSLAVPKDCADSAFAGFMLNALMAASTDNLDESLKTTYINYYFWSNEAGLMLNYVEDSLHYDLGVLYSTVPQVGAIGAELITGENNTQIPEEAKEQFVQFKEEVFG